MNSKSKNEVVNLKRRMFKVLSFENIINISRTQKLMKYLLFEEYQGKVLKHSILPTISKSVIAENEFTAFSNKISSTNEIKEVDRKLLMLIKNNPVLQMD